MKIKGRDVLFFFLGIVTILIIETAMNWNETKQLIKDSATDELKKIENEK
tara:strand:- start:80 stop:229 length:150 start_codon:yes stop_codon:yes gene_type:complete